MEQHNFQKEKKLPGRQFESMQYFITNNVECMASKEIQEVSRRNCGDLGKSPSRTLMIRLRLPAPCMPWKLWQQNNSIFLKQ